MGSDRRSNEFSLLQKWIIVLMFFSILVAGLIIMVLKLSALEENIKKYVDILEGPFPYYVTHVSNAVEKISANIYGMCIATGNSRGTCMAA